MKKLNSIIVSLVFFLSALFALVLLCLSGFGRGILQLLYPFDTKWLLLINGHRNPFWDEVMYLASDKLFWFPFYAIIIYFLWRVFEREFWRVLIFIALLIACSDRIASGLIKNTVKRLRPSHEPDLINLIHLSKAGSGGLYGFVSSHSANAFALAVFLLLLLDKAYRPLKITLLSWALLVAYSRVYNGVHYPSDVLVAALIGSLLGTIFYLFYQSLKGLFGNLFTLNSFNKKY